MGLNFKVQRKKIDMQARELLFEKIEQLPPQKIAEVINFVAFLAEREEKKLTEAAAKLVRRILRTSLGQRRGRGL